MTEATMGASAKTQGQTLDRVAVPGRRGPRRPPSGFCTVEGCPGETSGRKPYCPAHIDRLPYVAGLLETIARRARAEAARRARVEAAAGRRRVVSRVVSRELAALLEVVHAVKRWARCTDCGNVEPLTYDHLERAGKRFNVSNPRRRGRTVSRRELAAEILKCELVCRRCHDRRERFRDAARGLEALALLARAPERSDPPVSAWDAVARLLELVRAIHPTKDQQRMANALHSVFAKFRGLLGLRAPWLGQSPVAEARRQEVERELSLDVARSWSRGVATLIARERRRQRGSPSLETGATSSAGGNGSSETSKPVGVSSDQPFGSVA